ncbi:hypothetical protein Tco_0965588 [Tanacetum coccineum]
MRNKEGIDELDIDDLYNNLKVFEADIKGSFGSSSNSPNVAFLFAKDTNSINEVNTTNGVSTTVGHSSLGQASSSSYTDDLMFLFFANQSNSPQLNDEDIEQIDHDDLEEMDLKWQVAMLSMRVKRFYKKTGRKLIYNGKEPVGNRNRDTRYRSRDNTRRTVPVETSDALVVQDNALIVQDGLGYDWSYIAQDEPTEFALMAYTSNSSGSDTKEKIAVLEFEVKDKDKTGLGYGDELNESDSEVLNSFFDSRSSDGDDNQTNDRFKKGNEYHAVPPPLTGNYMPPLADLSFAELDDSVYRTTTNKASASISNGEASVTQTSNIIVEVPKDNSVRTNEVLIEDWVSDHEDIFQSEDSQTTVKPSFKKIECTKAKNEPVKSDKQAVKSRMITQYPKEKVNTVRVNGVNTAGQTVVSTVKGNGVTAVKASADSSQQWLRSPREIDSFIFMHGNPQQALKYKGMFNSGCSRHMTGNKALLTDYQDIDGGFVAFGRSTKGGKITSIGKIRTNKIDFEDVFFMKELKFNLFSVSQMRDKKNSVLFTETECLVLSPD